MERMVFNMKIKKYIPNSIKEHYKLLKVKKIYGEQVNSHLIHPNCTIGSMVQIAQGVDIRENVAIGNYTYVNKNSLVASGIIGKYCSIGYNCQIGVFEHPSNYLSTSPHIYRHKSLQIENKPDWNENDINNPPIIGNDVWIGSNVIIMQGVKIGDGAIIAAGAIVTKDVLPYQIVGGVPAKLIRKRFSDEIIEVLQACKWWEKSEEWISNNINEIIDIENSYKKIRDIINKRI